MELVVGKKGQAIGWGQLIEGLECRKWGAIEVT